MADPPLAHHPELLLSQLAARAAHDINNACAILGGYLHFLRTSTSDHESLREMKKAVERLHGLSRTLARIGAFADEEPGELDLNELARSAAETPAVALDLEEGLPLLRARRTAAAHTVGELLASARGVAGANGKVRLITRFVAPEGVALTIESATTPASAPARETATAERATPTVGWTLVATFAAMHSARLDHEEREGGGQRVTIVFPRSPAHSAPR